MSWIARGRTTAHTIADLCSTTTNPKVVDVERSSKQGSQCMGAELSRKSNPEPYEIFLKSHRCTINHTGPSGSMGRALINQMFKRSIENYNIQYHYYIGDGDAKVFKSLLDDLPYKNITVQQIEDVNHYAKRISNRRKRIKDDNKNKILKDSLKINDFVAYIIKFKT